MQSAWQFLSDLVWNIFNRPGLTDFIDIFIVAVIVYQLLKLTRETRASQVLKGFAILLLCSWLSELFKLRTLNYIMRWIVNSGAVVLVILFQPEIRRALEKLGRTSFMGLLRSDADQAEDERIIEELVQALLNMGKRRVGALIVIEQRTPLKDIIDTGTQVDARISQPLIENIFEPNTPLHDGAVVLRGHRVIAAGCLLQLSEGKSISRDLGTRHRAAMGVSESTDAITLIVSEETGIISYTFAGKMKRHMDAVSLTQLLRGIYLEPERGHTFVQWLRSRKERPS